jgi:iron complex outermembrane receptor protein
MIYGSLSGGFKAGGFNAASPAGREAYGEEHTWSAEGGAKTTWADGRVVANLAVFRIDWQDLQLNLPDPGVPGQFFISNVGGAASAGIELEVNARVHEAVDVFGALGVNRARFKQGSLSSGIDVSDNKVPNTPDHTASLGAQFTREVRPGWSLVVRGEAVAHGSFEYDDLNAARQDTYTLANLRAGLSVRQITVDLWVRNAFDTHYVPIAFSYPGLAPSGYLGESGRPRTFGVSTSVSF